MFTMNRKITLIVLVFLSVLLFLTYALIKNKKQINQDPLPVVANPCIKSGCSGQLCVAASNSDIISTCEWRDQYACYQTAECKLQSDGQCGFTQTDELNNCLQQKSSLNKFAN